MPIVIYIPEGFSVKYKIYKADSEWYEAPEVSEKVIFQPTQKFGKNINQFSIFKSSSNYFELLLF
jgi:lipopolysaccharide biosynthesis regulator YciM